MKIYLTLILFIISYFSFSQNNHIVKTEDGRRVLLKADYTWEYIDAKPKGDSKKDITEAITKKDDACNLPTDFKEPKLNNKIQNQLKKGRATIEHVKEKVAKDNNCTVDEVVLTFVSEHKTKGRYVFCANGKEVKYKRVGNNIIKNNKFF